MNDLRYGVIVILLIAVLTTSQALNILSSRTYQLIGDTRAIRLVAGCKLGQTLTGVDLNFDDHPLNQKTVQE